MKINMRVLLFQDIEKLGRKGEIKEVADGYANNFLLPKGLGALATPAAEAKWKLEMAKQIKGAERDLKRTQELASRLDGYELEIAAKAGEDGKLYGGIGAQKIAEELKKKDFPISKKQIEINEPIKTVGEHKVIIKFPHGLEAEVSVIIK